MTDNDQIQWLRDDLKAGQAEVKAELVALSLETQQQTRQVSELTTQVGILARRQDQANHGAEKAANRIVELEMWQRAREIALAEDVGEQRARRDTVLTRGQWTLIVGAATAFAGLIGGAIAIVDYVLRAFT